RIGVIYICAGFVIFFWSAFEQAGASLTFFADEQTNRDIGGWTMPASFFQSFNALFIVVFAPIMAWLWTYLDKKGKEPASPYKQAMGLFLLALGYLFIAFFVKGIDPNSKVTMFALIGLYWLHTMGELSLSPIGLSMVVKLSPVKFTSLLMGVWFLSMATSNKLAGVLSGLYPEDQSKELVASFDVAQLPDSVSWYSNAVSEVTEQNWEVETQKVLKEGDKDSSMVISKFALSPESSDFPDLKAKRILISSKFFVEASADEAKVCNATVAADRFLYGANGAKNEFYLIKEGKKKTVMEVWNLKPERPTFLGKSIETLYDFFMIFVGMAGAASVILFLLSKKLVRMMNGVR
ncbi:MAG: POT family proton-dependent oligopeptide transporter, partial [Bacteroidia bacterium]